MKQLTPSQTKKYDINQKIIHELTNLESRIVLFSIIKESKDTADISMTTKIPLSTVYQKLQNLEELSLVYVEKMNENVSRNTKYYKSRIMGIDISISKQEPKLILIKNKN
ncbi:helix-turn-helix domain-containing protein [Nitrosopumilus ureiphilus]|uniref:Transcriptional regulator n=1 Tax=Nitrosopumilus ureiphilus TaxID=1470067 RepID=A0A7D5R6X0_9ARCH|nr:helix-turn-helix domain-containing protein [Nitrosopumilus ureiphilus]QLH07297.1 transcriptional regulator [Nitrosopumilus ureiphilus]